MSSETETKPETHEQKKCDCPACRIGDAIKEALGVEIPSEKPRIKSVSGILFVHAGNGVATKFSQSTGVAAVHICAWCFENIREMASEGFAVAKKAVQP